MNEDWMSTELSGNKAPKQMTLREKKLHALGKDFGFFGMLSIAYGIAASFCLYRNPLGITVPLFVAVTYGVMFLVFRHMKIAVKRGSLCLAVLSFLIGLSTCFTANMIVGYHMNRLALMLLFCIFVLHQFHQDTQWNIGKYVSSIALYLVQAIGMLYIPFKHLSDFIRSIRSRKYKTVIRLLAGVCAAIPAAIILCILLASADMVFNNMLAVLIQEFLNPVTVFLVTIQAVAWMIILYCMVCSACAGEINDKTADRRTHSPVTAISFMFMIALIYLVFCIIQVVYLFMGRGSLPGGMTYSEYARQGFFQLLFVVMLNLVMVLMCLKYCKKNRLLNGILLVVSLCTYVMIASAVYRMILYVQQYHLTFLRVLVLWFLALLVVLMAGVVLLIFNNGFPLFRFCLGTISVFYLGFAWMKPDYVIAKYNVEHDTSPIEVRYMNLDLCFLSADAAPAILMMEDGRLRDELISGYAEEYDWVDRGNAGVRTFNFSVQKARCIEGKG